MTLPQFLAFFIMAAAMGLFVWGRLRFDLVALFALLRGTTIVGASSTSRLALRRGSTMIRFDNRSCSNVWHYVSEVYETRRIALNEFLFSI